MQGADARQMQGADARLSKQGGAAGESSMKGKNSLAAVK
jgi:hypothetical protein